MVVSEYERDVAVAAVRVESQPARAPGFAAIVKLCGEHDIATSEGINDALAAISGNVLVDLADCAFLESTVLCAFVFDARVRSLGGHRLELAVPESNAAVLRALQISGVTGMLAVQVTPEGDDPAS